VDINKKYKIPEDSRFEVNTISLLGEKAITITPGQSTTYLKPRSVVTGRNEDLMIKVKNILDQVNNSIKKGELDAKVAQLSQSLGTLQSVLMKLDKKVGDLNIAEYNHDIHQLGEAGKTAKVVFSKTSDSLQVTLKKFNTAMDNLAKLSTELHQIAVKINKGEGSAGKLVNDKAYIENLNKTLTELNALIVDLKKNPKKYVHLSLF